PYDVYETGRGGQVVLTVNVPSELGHPLPTHTREVLDSHLNPISGSGVIDIIGSGLLTGGAVADDITGSDGADTLIGGGGYDALYGRQGHDRFVFGLDGSVDRAADFSAADDTLSIVDGSGASLVSSTGILTFYRATG